MTDTDDKERRPGVARRAAPLAAVLALLAGAHQMIGKPLILEETDGRYVPREEQRVLRDRLRLMDRTLDQHKEHDDARHAAIERRLDALEAK